MKIFALLLSLFVLSLTAVPCCALEDGRAHQHGQNTNGHKEQKKSDKSEKEDGCCRDCSPFYVCGTCAGFTLSSYSLVTFTLYLKPILHNTAYSLVELPVIPLTIWQPPKLA